MTRWGQLSYCIRNVPPITNWRMKGSLGMWRKQECKHTARTQKHPFQRQVTEEYNCSYMYYLSVNVCLFFHLKLVHGLIPTRHSKIFIKRKKKGRKTWLKKQRKEKKMGKKGKCKLKWITIFHPSYQQYFLKKQVRCKNNHCNKIGRVYQLVKVFWKVICPTKLKMCVPLKPK